MTSPQLEEIQKQRARATIVAAAAGDALGANYAAQPDLLAALGDGPVPFATEGPWREGEWTSSTSMAVPLLKVINWLASDQNSDESVHPLNWIVSGWKSLNLRNCGWRLDDLISSLGYPPAPVKNEPLFKQCSYISRQQDVRDGRSDSSEAVARSVPVAIGFLGEGREAKMVGVATAMVRLTQSHPDVVEAAQLLSLALRSAILTGELNLLVHVDSLPYVSAQRKAFWKEKIAAAEKSTAEAFKDTNTTAVGALQAAIAANAGAGDVKTVLEHAIRAGGECNRVACLAGALAGARTGSVPSDLREKIWGESVGPGTAEELESLVNNVLNVE